MEKNKLTLAASPHLLSPRTVPHDMLWVIAALLPALLWGFVIFRLPAIILTITCIIGCVSGELFIQWLRKRSFKTIFDYSAILTGILLAMVLPPEFPIVLALFGSWFAIIIGKALFGGLGYNIFNPALLGRAFLQISFPVLMTTWALPKIPAFFGIDTISSATPLALLKFEHTSTSIWQLFLGTHGGCIGETSAALLLLGALLLIVKKIVDWRIPAAIFTTVTIWVLFFQMLPGVETGSLLFHFFSGGLMIGSFFMATDMVTSPITPKGSVIFGVGIGSILMIIRQFGGLPEAMMFSILIMNAFVPLINRHTRPRVFGEKRVNA